MHRREIDRLYGQVKEKGLTLIPPVAYINERGFVKIELALAKGKTRYDKREAIKEKRRKKRNEGSTGTVLRKRGDGSLASKINFILDKFGRLYVSFQVLYYLSCPLFECLQV